MKTTVTGAGLLAGALLLGQGGAAQATLVNYTSSGVNLVYDQDRNLTWVATPTCSGPMAAVVTAEQRRYGSVRPSLQLHRE